MVCASGVAGLAKKGRVYECHQYFLRSAYRPAHNSTAPLDAQTETTDCRVRNTTDVPVLRIDYIPTKGKLLGVWQALNGGGVLDFKEMNRSVGPRFPRIFFAKDI
jgi:hypothetical protein